MREARRLLLLLTVFLIVDLKCMTLGQDEDALCPEPMEDFNRTKFVGLWYVSHSTELPELPKMPCYQSDDAFFPNGTYISHDRFNYVHSENDQGIVDFVLTGIYIWSSPDRGEFYAQIPLDSVKQGPVLILDTDYDTYAVLYHCFKVGNKYDGMIVYRRNEDLDDLTLEAIESLCRKKGSKKPLLKIPRCDLSEKMVRQATGFK